MVAQLPATILDARRAESGQPTVVMTESGTDIRLNPAASGIERSTAHSPTTGCALARSAINPRTTLSNDHRTPRGPSSPASRSTTATPVSRADPQAGRLHARAQIGLPALRAMGRG